MTEERAYWLAWSKIKNVGPILVKRLQERFGSLGKAWVAPEEYLRQINGIGDKLIGEIHQKRSQINPEQLLEQHHQENINFWTPLDENYPRLLKEIPSPPTVLYYRGEVNLQENQGLVPLVGIVGTRNLTEYGRRWTHKISQALTKHGFTIVSGMAAGIDKEAHSACLAAGGRTIAVLGTGVDVIYPASNSQLYRRIQEQGLVLSEYELGTKPDKQNFPPRNRIIAGLCRAVLVIEAPIRSGALITARYGNEFCRDVYALPGSLDNPQSLGCLELIHKGGQVILSESHLLEMLGTIPQLDQIPAFAVEIPPDLAPDLAQVLSAITSDAIPFDLLVEKTGLASGDILSALSHLELLDLVTKLPGMRYRRIS
ncbi:MAG: DNA-processing protein DprA [Spirulinaceae cyanobacterium]